MNLAKAVANAAAMLVLKAKNVAQVAEDTVLQNRVIAAATQCALSTSQLVACTKVTLSNPGDQASSVSKERKDVQTISLQKCFQIRSGCVLKHQHAKVAHFLISHRFFPPRVAGCQPNHQLPSVSGAAGGGRQAGGPLRGDVRQGLPLGQRRQRAAEASRLRRRRGGPGPQRPAAARPPLRQLRRADRTLRPGHGHHHERDGKHFYFDGRRW